MAVTVLSPPAFSVSCWLLCRQREKRRVIHYSFYWRMWPPSATTQSQHAGRGWIALVHSSIVVFQGKRNVQQLPGGAGLFDMTQLRSNNWLLCFLESSPVNLAWIDYGGSREFISAALEAIFRNSLLCLFVIQWRGLSSLAERL